MTKPINVEAQRIAKIISDTERNTLDSNPGRETADLVAAVG